MGMQKWKKRRVPRKAAPDRLSRGKGPNHHKRYLGRGGQKKKGRVEERPLCQKKSGGKEDTRQAGGETFFGKSQFWIHHGGN